MEQEEVGQALPPFHRNDELSEPVGDARAVKPGGGAGSCTVLCVLPAGGGLENIVKARSDYRESSHSYGSYLTWTPPKPNPLISLE